MKTDILLNELQETLAISRVIELIPLWKTLRSDIWNDNGKSFSMGYENLKNAILQSISLVGVFFSTVTVSYKSSSFVDSFTELQKHNEVEDRCSLADLGLIKHMGINSS